MSEVYKIQVNDSEPIEVSQQVYEVSFCFNEMLKEKDKEIEKLNKELEEKEAILGGIQQLEAEIERLNNIINELEEELDKEYDTYITKNVIYGKTFKAGANVFREHIKYRLQEIKGDDKE